MLPPCPACSAQHHGLLLDAAARSAPRRTRGCAQASTRRDGRSVNWGIRHCGCRMAGTGRSDVSVLKRTPAADTVAIVEHVCWLGVTTRPRSTVTLVRDGGAVMKQLLTIHRRDAGLAVGSWCMRTRSIRSGRRRTASSSIDILRLFADHNWMLATTSALGPHDVDDDVGPRSGNGDGVSSSDAGGPGEPNLKFVSYVHVLQS